MEGTCLTPFPKSTVNLLFQFGQVALLTNLVIVAHQSALLCKCCVSYRLDFVGESVQSVFVNATCDTHMLFGTVTDACLTFCAVSDCL